MRLSYLPAENALRLTLDRERGEPSGRVTLSGYIDMGEGGRIVGLEALFPASIDLHRALGPWLADQTASEYVSLGDDAAYIELSAPEEASLREQVRAVAASITAEVDAGGELVALTIPRHGAGYEISYPSGNQ